MAPQPCSAQKRPLSTDDIDDGSESNAASEESGQVCVIAPPPGETHFPSWEGFEAYLARYQTQSLQLFRVPRWL
ncbi:hypothetical protein PC118_g18845, partial [Phytophthora cactorum]